MWDKYQREDYMALGLLILAFSAIGLFIFYWPEIHQKFYHAPEDSPESSQMIDLDPVTEGILWEFDWDELPDATRFAKIAVDREQWIELDAYSVTNAVTWDPEFQILTVHHNGTKHEFDYGQTTETIP